MKGKPALSLILLTMLCSVLSAQEVRHDLPYAEEIYEISRQVNELRSKWEAGDIECYQNFERWYRMFEFMENRFKERYPESDNKKSRYSMKMVFLRVRSFGWALESLDDTKRRHIEARVDRDPYLEQRTSRRIALDMRLASKCIDDALAYCEEAQEYISTRNGIAGGP